MIKILAALAFAGFLAQGAAALATDTTETINARTAALQEAAQ